MQEIKNIDAKILTIAEVLKSNKESSISLMGGAAGTILYWGYMYKYYNKKKYLSTCYENIEQALAMLNNPQASYPTFASGHIGLLWTLCHLYRQDLIEIEPDFFDAFDSIALQFAVNELKQKNYDYLHGALGAAVYFLERMPAKSAEKALNKILDELLALSVEQPEGIAWREYYLSVADQDVNTVYYNLGLSHGIPSIIAILTLCVKAGVKKNIAANALKKAISWLLSVKNDSSKTAVFPYNIGESKKNETRESRLAWCYGDLGASYAIFMAGNETGNQAWKEEAVAIALKACKRRDPLENKKLDAGICHGTSGIAYIFFKYYVHTGIKAFKEASDFWQQQTLLLSKYKTGIGGYKRYDAPSSKMINDFGLLEGVAGIGLVFSAIRKKQYFEWDRCLLLS